MIDDLYVLDTGPLGLASNPRESGAAGRLRAWIYRELAAGSSVMVPDVVAYEVRRELVRASGGAGLRRLAKLLRDLGRIAITGEAWDRAADLWAEARRGGIPTAPDLALDADLLIAAVAQLAGEVGWNVVVVTDNPRHLGRFADVRDWRALDSP